MSKKYKYRNKKIKDDFKDCEIIIHKIEMLDKLESRRTKTTEPHYLAFDTRNFYLKVIDYITLTKIRLKNRVKEFKVNINKWLKLNYKEKLKHIRNKLIIMLICWLIVNFGFAIPKEIMLLIDILN